MNTEIVRKFTPEIIVTEKCRFMIPLYQRLFAWSQKEVRVFLYDLKLHFESGSVSPFYFGVVTTVIFKDGYYSLIDGQQRFTILMLMAAVFKKFSPQWDKFFNRGDRLWLFAREDDARYISALADGDVNYSDKNPLMKEGYEEIRYFIECMDEQTRGLFIEYSYKKIVLFNSVLPEEYLHRPSSLNKYFEVINSEGANLEQHEKLKVLLLKGQENQSDLLAIWNICSDFSRPLIKKTEDEGLLSYFQRYERLANMRGDEAIQWLLDQGYAVSMNTERTSFPSIAEIDVKAHDFNNPFAGNKERSVVSFPEFLLLTLDIFCGAGGDWDFYKTDRLIELFNKFLKSERIKEFYYKMLKLRVLIDCYLIRRSIDGTDSTYNLTFKSKENSLSHECLKQYEAMLDVSTPYYKWVKPLLIYLDEKLPDDEEVLLKFIKNMDNGMRTFPDSINDLSYKSKPDRYWFWRLDYNIWERVFLSKTDDKNELSSKLSIYRKAILEYTFRANRSIEHLHPQNQSENEWWPETAVHSFGNLAMISQGFNSQQGNEDVIVKFSRVESQARNKQLQSLKLLMMYVDSNRESEGWTIEVADRHGNEMYKILSDSMKI